MIAETEYGSGIGLPVRFAAVARPDHIRAPNPSRLQTAYSLPLENNMHEYDDFMGDKRTEMMVLTVLSAIVIGVIYVGWRIYNG